MTPSKRQQLGERLRAEVDSASARLLDDPNSDVGDHLARIDAYSRLLSATGTAQRDSRNWAIVFTVVCVVVVSFLAVQRTRDTRLLLDVVTTMAAFQVGALLDWSDHLALAPQALRVDGLSSIDARFFAPLVASEHHEGWLNVDTGGVALTRLQLAKDGIIELEHGGGRRFAMFLRDAALTGEFQVMGDVVLDVGAASTAKGKGMRSLAVPETITVSRRAEGIAPVTVQATLGEDWFLKDLPVRMISMNREVPTGPGTVTLVSSLKSGTISFPEVARQVTLRERDHLTLAGVNGLLIEARLKDDGVHLVFQGSADGIRLGPPGRSQDLAPTYLEYLYQNQPLALFWAAVSFLGGILWGVRQTLFA